MAEIEHMLYRGRNEKILPALAEQGRKYDLIYLDPPYNTGMKILGYADAREDAEWEQMIASTIELCKSVLAPDGLIIISIDDEHFPELRMVCDAHATYGGSMIWKKRSRLCIVKGKLSGDHEFLAVYGTGKNPPLVRDFTRDPKNFSSDDGDGRGPYRLERVARNFRAKFTGPFTYEGREYWPYNDRSLTIGPRAPKVWRFSQKHLRFLADHGALTAKGDDLLYKNYRDFDGWMRPGEGGRVPASSLDFLPDGRFPAPMGSRGSAEISACIGRAKFAFPKPIGLLQRVIRLLPRQNRRIQILDPFAGSATTLAAAITLNGDCANGLASDGEDLCACTLIGDDGDSGRQFSEVTAERAVRTITGRDWADGKSHPDFSKNQKLQVIC